MKLTKLPSLLFLIAFLVASCGTPPPPSSQGVSNPNTNIEIQITGTEPIELGTETIYQPNCTGTAEVENSIEKSRTIQYVMEVQNGASVNANGQVGFAGTDIELGATVASQFGQSYGTSETLTRSITVKAKPGTNMQHVIRQVEIWKTGQAKISVGGQQIIIPFKFRSDFAIELVNSQNIYPNGCDSLPTETPFTGTWQGIDPVDGSIITISLVQTGNMLVGTLADTYSGDLEPPGYHGNGSGTLTSPVTAEITFSNLIRSDGKTAEWKFYITLSNEKDSLTVDGCFFKDSNYEGSTGCPTIMNRK